MTSPSTGQKSERAIWCVALVLFLSMSYRLYASDWKVETIDAGGGGKFTTLLFDKGGNAHVSYVNDQLHQLRYAYWDRALNKWFVMVVDNRCSGFTSMALDSQGLPHISYIEYGTLRLKYAHYKKMAWHLQVIPIVAKQIDYYTSITLDAHDSPSISFYEYLGLETAVRLRIVRWTGTYWALVTVDPTRGSGKFNAIASNAAGALQVAYSVVEYLNAGLRYARFNGKTWEVEMLEGAEGPHPCYSTNGVMDAGGVPHLTYVDVFDFSAKKLKYATKRGENWQIEVVDSMAQEAWPDRYGITIAPDGTVYIAYFDSGLGALKLAHRRDGKWTREIVEQSGTAGFTSSVKVTGGEVYITYFDSGTYSLKWARRPVGTDGHSEAQAGRKAQSSPAGKPQR